MEGDVQWSAVYSLDRSPVHHRAKQTHTGQTTMHTLIPKDNVEKSVNVTVTVLDFERKLEYPEGNHTCIMH